MITQVMKFGVRSIIEHEEEALKEMSAAHSYYNALMRVHLMARKRYREIRETYVPGMTANEERLRELNEQIGLVYDEIKLNRKELSKPKARGGKASPKKPSATPEQKARIESLKAERKTVSGALRAQRAEFEAMLAPGREAYEARTSGASMELLQQIKTIGAQLKEAKRIRNNPDVPKLKRALDDLKKIKKKGAPATHKKRAVNESVLEKMLTEKRWHRAWKDTQSLDSEKRAKVLMLRAECGLTHGTYAATEDAVEQALKTADGDPRERFWDGGRKIGRQIQPRKVKDAKVPMTGADLYSGQDSRLRIVSRQPLRGRKDPVKRVERTAGSRRSFWEYAIVSFPIGKDDAKRWVSVEVLLHRAVPANAHILWVYLVPRRVGLRTIYTLQLTVQTEQPLIRREHGEGECLVKLKWSRDKSSDDDAAKRGIVVAEINGEAFAMDGVEYRKTAARFVQRGGAYSAMLLARRTRGASDTHFETAKSELKAWLSNNKSPKWLKEATDPVPSNEERPKGRGHISQWRNHKNMVRVAWAWADNMMGVDLESLWKCWLVHCKAGKKKVPGKIDLFPEREYLNAWLAERGIEDESNQMGVWLDWWRRKDKHLLQMAADLDRKGRLNRKNQYRLKASQLANQYATVAVFEHDLAKTAKRKTPDRDEDELHKQARYQRTAACPSEFKEALKLAFGPDRYREVKREQSGDGGDPGGARIPEIQPSNDSGKAVAAE